MYKLKMFHMCKLLLVKIHESWELSLQRPWFGLKLGPNAALDSGYQSWKASKVLYILENGDPEKVTPSGVTKSTLFNS